MNNRRRTMMRKARVRHGSIRGTFRLEHFKMLLGTKRRDYAGILTKPINRPRVALKFEGAVTSERADELARIVEQELSRELKRRFEALFEHFDVPCWDWQSLTLALANRHVPAFRIVKRGPGGRPKAWTSKRLLKLFAAVEEVKSALAIKSDLDAIRRLVKRTEEWKRWSVPTLEARLQDAKSFKRLFDRA